MIEQTHFLSFQFTSAVQSCPTLCNLRASLSITSSQSLLKLMSPELVMPPNCLILCHPLFLLSIYSSIRVFSNEPVFHIRWPKFWSSSFSISPSIEDSGLISTMVEVMKIMETSFNRSHACTVTLTAHNSEACHCQPTPLWETPGYSWESLDQFLVGSLILSCKSRKSRNTWSNR